jgi:hypothetical protein
MAEQNDTPNEQPTNPPHTASDMLLRSVRAWNELLNASTDMAFDAVLRNWDYSRSLRSSAEQAIEDALKTQHRLNREMLQAWQGYASNVKEILEKQKE